ncbi:uncharacterized protein At2g29880-like [Ziziphus jujuba]|uniref:Uncharacterized protein At2g29880-like n=1 Tax=Ziziphus jujuba TaxID=326968 RepID=A0ABM4A2B2_ZIZJJ|nr:uncharacterized protein At2g29880-like [Ziziphus jujuba]
MGDSQRKGKTAYNIWTSQESNMLLELMVDAANRGWRDNNGVFSKLTVESKILPKLNEALGCNKNYTQYQGRLKWFKTYYQTFSQLMRFNFGFGWDAATQRFTATDEIWDNYFKSHPNQKHLRTDTFADFEDLKIAVGNGTAIGKNSIGLGDDTDARIYGQDESTHGRIDDYVYDEINEVYVPTQLDPSCQAPSLGHNEPSMSEFDPNLEVPMENVVQRKRTRNEYEGNTRSFDQNATRVYLLEKLSHGLDSIGKIATEIWGMYNLMEKREKATSEKEKKNDIWNVIKETPNLDNIGRYKALALIQKMGVKDAFLKMLPEERSEWISFNME